MEDLTELVITRHTILRWTGIPLTAGEFARLVAAIPHSSVPDAISTIITNALGVTPQTWSVLDRDGDPIPKATLCTNHHANIPAARVAAKAAAAAAGASTPVEWVESTGQDVDCHAAASDPTGCLPPDPTKPTGYTLYGAPAGHQCWDDPAWDGTLTIDCPGCQEATLHPCQWCGYGRAFTTHNPEAHLDNGDRQLADNPDQATDDWCNSPHLYL